MQKDFKIFNISPLLERLPCVSDAKREEGGEGREKKQKVKGRGSAVPLLSPQSPFLFVDPHLSILTPTTQGRESCQMPHPGKAVDDKCPAFIVPRIYFLFTYNIRYGHVFVVYI